MCSCPLTGRPRACLLPERPEMCPQGSRAASRGCVPRSDITDISSSQRGFNLPVVSCGLYLYRGAGGTGVSMWKSETGLQAWAHSPWWRLAGVWGPAPWALGPHRDKQPVQLFSGVGSGQSWSRSHILCPHLPQEQFYSQYSAERGTDLCIQAGPFWAALSPHPLPSRALLCPCTGLALPRLSGHSQGEPSMYSWQKSGVMGWGTDREQRGDKRGGNALERCSL